MLYEFVKCRPDQLRKALEEFPCAYIPLGSLEWHGPHLPLGTDGMKVEKILQNVGKIFDKGVLFPTWYYGSFKTLAFPFTFHFSKRHLQTQLSRYLEELIQMGFQMIILLTGHYPPTLVAFLQKLAKAKMGKYSGVFILACPEYFLIESQDLLGDHAGSTESALSAYYYPDFTDLSRLPENYSYIDRCKKLGIFDAAFDKTKSYEYGKKLAEEIETNLVRYINRVWVEKNATAFMEVYGRANSIMQKSRNLKDIRVTLKKVGIESKSDLKAYLKWIIFERGHHKTEY